MFHGTREELAEWGRKEWAARKADLASMHSGGFTLAEVQDRAKKRRRAVGLTKSQATAALPPPGER